MDNELCISVVLEIIVLNDRSEWPLERSCGHKRAANGSKDLVKFVASTPAILKA